MKALFKAFKCLPVSSNGDEKAGVRKKCQYVPVLGDNMLKFKHNTGFSNINTDVLIFNGDVSNFNTDPKLARPSRALNKHFTGPAKDLS